ncbi:MAG: hypothetical protein LHV69_05870 [Elusimicrobia bacterium]|nr:hypothetical protein [Candidatus Obscuribacterium magneticum]
MVQTRYELYSLRCTRCDARNSPVAARCSKCGAPVVQWRRCHFCQFENPPNACLCLTCYHVLKGKPQTGLLHMQLPWGVPVVVLTVVFGWFGLQLARSWFAYAEAQVERSVVSDQYLALQRMEWKAKQRGAEKAGESPVP